MTAVRLGESSCNGPSINSRIIWAPCAQLPEETTRIRSAAVAPSRWSLTRLELGRLALGGFLFFSLGIKASTASKMLLGSYAGAGLKECSVTKWEQGNTSPSYIVHLSPPTCQGLEAREPPTRVGIIKTTFWE